MDQVRGDRITAVCPNATKLSPVGRSQDGYSIGSPDRREGTTSRRGDCSDRLRPTQKAGVSVRVKPDYRPISARRLLDKSMRHTHETADDDKADGQVPAKPTSSRPAPPPRRASRSRSHNGWSARPKRRGHLRARRPDRWRGAEDRRPALRFALVLSTSGVLLRSLCASALDVAPELPVQEQMESDHPLSDPTPPGRAYRTAPHHTTT